MDYSGLQLIGAFILIGMIIFFIDDPYLKYLRHPKNQLFFPSQLFYWELCFTSFLNLKVFNEGLSCVAKE